MGEFFCEVVFSGEAEAAFFNYPMREFSTFSGLLQSSHIYWWIL